MTVIKPRVLYIVSHVRVLEFIKQFGCLDPQMEQIFHLKYASQNSTLKFMSDPGGQRMEVGFTLEYEQCFQIYKTHWEHLLEKLRLGDNVPPITI